MLCVSGLENQPSQIYVRGMSILAENIRSLRSRFASQTEFGEAVGVGQSTIVRWEKGSDPKPENLLSLAKLAECSVEHLITTPLGEQPRVAPIDDADEDDDDDTVEIQEMDFAYGMGGGTYLDLPVTATPQRLSRGLLRSFTQSPPQRIFVARGTGDSMMPTILDGDIVLVDTSENRVLAGDKIWAITYGMAGLIKRLRPMPDGSVKILSDNPSVPPEIAYDGEMTVVGRVVGVLRKT